MKKITSIVLLIVAAIITSCNSDEPKFTASQIKAALSEMKGAYQGDVTVSYYHGEDIADNIACKFSSDDSLTVQMDLTQMASVIADEAIAARLRDAGTITVKAGYDFYQMDEQIYNFVLRPKDAVLAGTDAIKIVFSQNFGGDADIHNRNMIYNLSPAELWVGGKKYEPFRQLVYHYEGTTE